MSVMKAAALPLFLLVSLSSCVGSAGRPATSAPSIAKADAAFPVGYLGKGPLPGGLLLVPPPPPVGSAAEARDKEGAAAALAVRGSARWDLAASDADLRPGHAQASLSCAAGLVIGQKDTPALYRLLSRAAADLGVSTDEVKGRYMRPRPFMVNGEPSCTPTWEAALRRNGSYPSGHSAIGYGLSLILAELIPDRAAVIVARGRSYGDSRRICNVHWLSDIEEGRMIATATVMRLNADPAFLADLAKARTEVQAVRARPQAERSECAKETQALRG